MKTPDLSEWVQRFSREYLSRQRNVSPATLAAYRDTFRLLLQYWRQRRRQDLATLSLENLTADTVLGFLTHLEESRGNTIRTRNARLAFSFSVVSHRPPLSAFNPLRRRRLGRQQAEIALR